MHTQSGWRSRLFLQPVLHVRIKVMRTVFTTHDLPEVIMSDNGTAFTSAEFQEFLRQNGVRHITSAPYHPSTNGVAERAVQTSKDALRKDDSGDIETRLSNFLFHYRTTPHTTTGISLAELLMGRRIRTRPNQTMPVLFTGTKPGKSQDMIKVPSQENLPLMIWSL